MTGDELAKLVTLGTRVIEQRAEAAQCKRIANGFDYQDAPLPREWHGRAAALANTAEHSEFLLMEFIHSLVEGFAVTAAMGELPAVDS